MFAEEKRLSADNPTAFEKRGEKRENYAGKKM
jgi:hypothetical protein